MLTTLNNLFQKLDKLAKDQIVERDLTEIEKSIRDIRKTQSNIHRHCSLLTKLCVSKKSG